MPIVILAGGIFWYWNVHTTGQSDSHTYDVVVVGAGPGGIAASIQAARAGANVALLEETDWIGGQLTSAGVGTIDEGSTVERKSGLYKEFVQHVTDFYSSHHKSTGTCYYGIDTLCVEPKVGQAILKQMLGSEASHLHVYTGTAVTDVTRNGDTVTGVTAGSAHFSSKVVIDASEYGDVIAKAGAAYRLGNKTAENQTPNTCIQNITHTAVMKYYPDGVPSSLTMKRPPPKYTPAVARHFAAFLKQNGYELTVKPGSRYASRKAPMSFTAYASYRGYPDLANPNDYNAFEQDGHIITRTSLNLGNDYPHDGTLKTSYITDNAIRAKSNCDAKLLTLQLVYYIQHDLGQRNWSIANDEGYDTSYNQQHHCPELNGYEVFENNMPQEPYVREARRLVGTETLTGNELQYAWKDKSRLPKYPDSIAVGYYPMDLHSCNTADSLESQYDSLSDLRPVFVGSSFEVPLGVLIPEKIDGLLAAEKNVSASRLANGAIREQPIAMNIGQAAGELAALAASAHKQPREVPDAQVQAELKKAHVIIATR